MKLPRELRPSLIDMTGLWRVRPYFERVKETIMADLVKQPTNRPTNKVLMAGGGVSVAALLWLARKVGFDLAPADAEIIVAALGVVLSYFVVMDRANTGPKSK